MKKFKFNKVLIAIALVFTIGLVGLTIVKAIGTAVGLGTSENFAVLAGAAISDTGSNSSAITGNVGLSPTGGTAITVLSCTQVTGIPGITGTGKIYDTNGLYPGGYNSNTACRITSTSVLNTAKADLKLAYNNALGQPSDFSVTASTTNSFAAISAGTYVLTPGVYTSLSSMGVPVALTLNGGGNPNAIFIFQADSTLDTVTDSVITLTNGAQACNVFWQVGSSATLETGSHFAGTIMAAVSITAKTNSVVNGRLLADANNGVPNHTGAVTLDATTVTVPTCATTHLIVTKTVVGGPSSVHASNFNTTITGVTTATPTAPGSESGVDNILTSLGTFTVIEDVDGYTDTYEGCGPTLITLGDTKHCYITNTYQTPTLTLNKIVVGGSSAESAWTLAADGLTPISGPGATDSADVVSEDTFLAGTYTLSESAGPANYTASAWSCVINDDAPVIGSSVVIAPNDDVVCTITNTYHAPSSGGGGYMRPTFLPSINIISTPVVIAPIIPKLPKTGYPREERSAMLPIVLLSGLSLVSIFLYFAQKKQTT